MVRSPMPDMPAEVLLVILEHVQATATHHELLQCVRCCRKWHDIALPLLYERVPLTNKNFVIFALSLTANTALVVRSLTITIFPKQPMPKDQLLDQLPLPYPDIEHAAARRDDFLKHKKRAGDTSAGAIWTHLHFLGSRLPDVSSTIRAPHLFAFQQHSSSICRPWLSEQAKKG